MSLYINAVSSAKEVNLLTPKQITELKNAKNYAEFKKLLQSTSYGYDKSLENTLEEKKLEIINFVLKDADLQMKNIFKIWLEYDNALAFYKNNNLPSDNLFFASGFTSILDLKEAIETKNFDKIKFDTLKKDLTELEVNKILDVQIFLTQKKLLAIKRCVKRGKIRDYFNLLVDFFNLKLILINKPIYKNYVFGALNYVDLINVHNKSFLCNTNQQIYAGLIKILYGSKSFEQKLKAFNEELNLAFIRLFKEDSDEESPSIFLNFLLKSLREIEQIRFIAMQKKYLI